MKRLLRGLLLLAIVASSLLSTAGTADAGRGGGTFNCLTRNVTWERCF